MAYDENYEEAAALAQLFGFSRLAVNASSSYMQQYAKALHLAWAHFAQAQELIVIEEELLLTIDFANYLNQLLPILRQDKSIALVSAWNDNGERICRLVRSTRLMQTNVCAAFNNSASLVDAVYRIDDGTVPALGYMLRRDFYERRLAGRMSECCTARVWDGWRSVLDADSNVVLVPDMPRIARRHADGLGILSATVEHMFHRPRAFVK